MKIKLTYIALLTVFFVPVLFAQTDSSFRFDNIDVSFKYDQGILRKDPETGNYVKTFEEKEVINVYAIIIQRDRIIAPEENISLPLINLNTLRINGKRDYGKSISKGALIGAITGAVPTLFFAFSSSNSSEVGYCFAVGGILTAMTTAAGCVLGFLATPKEYEEIKLFGYENSGKKKILIESLNKSKTQKL